MSFAVDRKSVSILFLSNLFLSVVLICALTQILLLRFHTDLDLNTRQQKILSDMKLPTKYWRLSSQQKDMISSIESALLYIENKYKVQPTFVDYSLKRNAATITMMVDDTKITVVDAHHYSDDYVDKVIKDKYFDEIQSFFIEYGIPDDQYKLFTYVTSYYCEKDDVLRDCNSNILVLFDASQMKQKELLNLVMNFSNFVKARTSNAYTFARFVTLTSKQLQYVNEQNALDYCFSKYVEFSYMCESTYSNMTYFCEA